MSILVTGGAGYIGSHVAHALLDRGASVVVLDDLSTGVRAQVGAAAHFVEGSIADLALVERTVKFYGVAAVLNFAGSIVVPESVANPLAYYDNNVSATRTLIDTCLTCGVKRFIFSSTATVYDTDAPQPLTEKERKAPISPYARSKLMVEWML